MIKNRKDEKCTPKQFAAEILYSNVDSASYWQEQEDLKNLSQRELDLIDKQVMKLQERINKILLKIIK